MKAINIKSSIIILLLIIFSLSATYAFLNLGTPSNAATGTAGCFEVNYTGQAISNSALVSTTTYTEGASSNVVLSKSEDCEIYTEADIMIHTNDSTTAPISNGALKFKILQGTTEINSGTITTTGDTKLATVTLSTTATTYTVYIWIDSDISIGTYNGTTYSGYLYANSTQTSTIKTDTQ